MAKTVETNVTIVEKLVGLAMLGNMRTPETHLFRAPDGSGHIALYSAHGEKTVYAIQSLEFEQWLRNVYRQEYAGVARSGDVQDAIRDIEAAAHDKGVPIEAVYMRVGESKDGQCIYVDLCNEDSDVVEITAEGWRIISNPPVHFIRTPDMQSLPVPEQGGCLRDLRKYLNLSDHNEHTWTFVAAWLVGSLNLTGAYAVMGISGESGAAKTTAMRVLARMIDPLDIEEGEPHTDSADLFLDASSHYVLSIDNLSSIPQWMSDSMCRIATGGGRRTRALYTNKSQVSIKAKRPIIFNGIEEVAIAEDLLQRTLLVKLPAMPEDGYMTEKAFWREFEQDWPRLLGALYNAVSMALANQEVRRNYKLPRLADFALWVLGAEASFAEEGAFIAALESNRQDATAIELEASVAAKAIQSFMTVRNAQGLYASTITGLYDDVTAQYDKKPPRNWPRSAHQFSGQLRRHMKSLRAIGITIEFSRNKDSRLVTITDKRQKPTMGDRLQEAKRASATSLDD